MSLLAYLPIICPSQKWGPSLWMSLHWLINSTSCSTVVVTCWTCSWDSECSYFSYNVAVEHNCALLTGSSPLSKKVKKFVKAYRKKLKLISAKSSNTKFVATWLSSGSLSGSSFLGWGRWAQPSSIQSCTCKTVHDSKTWGCHWRGTQDSKRLLAKT